MNPSRRFFLGGTLALIGAKLIPFFRDIPELWGDCIHDDTEGLQAFFDNKPVKLMKDKLGLQQYNRAIIQGGEYLISDTLYMRNPDVYLDIHSMHLKTVSGFEQQAKCVIVIEPKAKGYIHHCYIEGPEEKRPDFAAFLFPNRVLD